jgi:hypothetical protein
MHGRLSDEPASGWLKILQTPVSPHQATSRNLSFQALFLFCTDYFKVVQRCDLLLEFQP